MGKIKRGRRSVGRWSRRKKREEKEDEESLRGGMKMEKEK